MAEKLITKAQANGNVDFNKVARNYCATMVGLGIGTKPDAEAFMKQVIAKHNLELNWNQMKAFLTICREVLFDNHFNFVRNANKAYAKKACQFYALRGEIPNKHKMAKAINEKEKLSLSDAALRHFAFDCRDIIDAFDADQYRLKTYRQLADKLCGQILKKGSENLPGPYPLSRMIEEKGQLGLNSYFMKILRGECHAAIESSKVLAGKLKQEALQSKMHQTAEKVKADSAPSLMQSKFAQAFEEKKKSA